MRPRLCATTRRPFASDVRACATGGGGRESVRRALRVRQATASPMICFSCERIPDSPRCHSFTLVDKGTPESALEMCGYWREGRILSKSRNVPAGDMHLCELVRCESRVYVRFAPKSVCACARGISLSRPPCPSSLVCLGLFGCCAAEAVCNDAASIRFGRACVCHRWGGEGVSKAGTASPPGHGLPYDMLLM